MNNKEKLLEILFEEPSKQFHIRLLARLAKINPNTVINISNLLLKEGLISKYKDKDTLWDVIQDAWNNIAPETFHNLAKSMKKRCTKVLKRNGKYINY